MTKLWTNAYRSLPGAGVDPGFLKGGAKVYSEVGGDKA